MEIREKIICGSEELFMKYGFKSITMDDIARHLSISKKTIYQFFKDKDDLICIVTEAHLKEEKREIDEVHQMANNAIEELYLISKCMRKNLSEVNTSVMYDLQKYHKKAWGKFLDFKDEVLGNAFKEVLIKGVKEGHFRQEIDVEILARLRLAQVQLGFDENVYPHEQFNFKDVQIQLFDHFVHGITTPKGQELLDQYFINSKE